MRAITTKAAEDIVGLSEIADIYGISRQLANRWAGVEGFPEPVRSLKQGRLWSARGVEAWVSANRPEQHRAAQAA